MAPLTNKHFAAIPKKGWGEAGCSSSKSMNFSSQLQIGASLTESSEHLEVSLLLLPGEKVCLLTMGAGYIESQNVRII